MRPGTSIGSLSSCYRKVFEEFLSGNLARAEPFQMSRRHLAVDQHEIPAPEKVHEANESDLGGIGLSGEHGFPEKDASQNDPIETSNQLSVQPAFHRMDIPEPMQEMIGLNHFRNNPGPFSVLSFHHRTLLNDFQKGFIHGHLEEVLRHYPLEAL